MMMKTRSVLVFALTLANAEAAVLTVTPSENKLERVTIGSKASAQIGAQNTPLEYVGSGVRKKTILGVKVYVAQFFVEKKDQFVKTPKDAKLSKDLTSLNSLPNVGTLALQLNFLRDLEADKVANSFADALDANSLKPSDDEGLKKVLSAVKKNGDVKSGESISIIGVNGATTDKLIIENGKGVSETIEGDAKLVDKMFAIWLGIPADGGLETLKGELAQ